ncbi:MAG: RluA family pseudouridine synthase [Clostridiaceae bacterium]|nr:RluA family pseudouridine synthase [Clostridiaceae bacterium]
MKEFTINKNDSGQRLDKYLAKALPLLPSSLMHKYLRLKRIKCNGKRCDAGQKLVESDVLSLYINDEFFEKPSDDRPFLLTSSDIDIIYEDDNILLVNKKPGMVVHEDESHTSDTLINRIQSYLFNKKEWDPEKENSFAPSLCNRIDRNTGGIVIAAKTAEALRIINEKIRLREIDKYYLCLVHGIPNPPVGTLKNYIARNTDEKRVYITSQKNPDSLTAITDYKVLSSGKGLSLVECRLRTGRTHQIRAQMASFGHPLAGDTKYGLNRDNKNLPFKYQALYSYKLIFSFKTSAGSLDYLKDKTFTVKNVPFVDYIK